MQTYQEKVLAEFERLAKLFACEPTIEEKYANTGRVVAHRSWMPVAYLEYNFQSGGKNDIRFNGARLGPGPTSVLWSSDDAENLEAAFDYWRDMLYEGYECDDCGDHHRPGTKCPPPEEYVLAEATS